MTKFDWAMSKKNPLEIEQLLKNDQGKLFFALWENSPDGLFLVDESGTIKLCNKLAEQLTGYQRLELEGQLINKLVPREIVSQHSQWMGNYFLQPRTRPMGTNIDLNMICKDGSIQPVEIGLSPVQVQKHQLVICSVRSARAIRKITMELQRKADLLERSNNELKHFASVASHDLQEPLRMMLSYLNVIKTKYNQSLDDKAARYIDVAFQAGQRMQDLILDLLSYSRVTSRPVKVSEVDLNQLLQMVQANLNSTIEECKAEITIANLPTLALDKTQMGQLFQNLISNGIKFSGNKKVKIEIGAEPKGTHYLFYVKDYGIGLEPEKTSSAFNIFQRHHSHDDVPGTGVGLSICKKIVEKHGGRIWMESQLGEFTVVYFTLSARMNT